MLTATCLLGGEGITDRVTHGHDADRFVQLGSLSKVVTGTVLTRLADQGVTDLDAPLEDCLTEVPRGTGITLRHLAEHTSGLPRLPPDDTGPAEDPYADFTDHALEALLRDLDRVTTKRPGAAEEYSNLGYAVLGRALTEVSGRTYQQLVDQCVLAPLDLAEGAVTASPPADRRLVARTLFGRPRAPWTLTGPILPSGGLWSTPRTMATVLVGLLIDRRLGPPAPTWRRGNSSTLWHNGATRGASAVAVANDDGRWLLLHRLHGNAVRTDRMAIKAFEASRPSVRS